MDKSLFVILKKNIYYYLYKQNNTRMAVSATSYDSLLTAPVNASAYEIKVVNDSFTLNAWSDNTGFYVGTFVRPVDTLPNWFDVYVPFGGQYSQTFYISSNTFIENEADPLGAYYWNFPNGLTWNAFRQDLLSTSSWRCVIEGTSSDVIPELLSPALSESTEYGVVIPTQLPSVFPAGQQLAYPIATQPNFGTLVNSWLSNPSLITSYSSSASANVESLLSVSNRAVAVRYHSNYAKVLEDALNYTLTELADNSTLTQQMNVVKSFVTFLSQNLELMNGSTTLLSYSGALNAI
jgi:hypothetical protein